MAPLDIDQDVEVPCNDQEDDEASGDSSNNTRRLTLSNKFSRELEHRDVFSTVKVARAVRFKPTVEVLFVAHFMEYTLEEKACTWYNAYDYISIDRRRSLAIDKLNQTSRKTSRVDNRGKHLECEEDSTHGLCSTAESIRKQSIVQQAKLALFTEQEFLWNQDLNDPDILADVYFQATSECQLEAILRGEIHAKYVRIFLKTSPREEPEKEQK